VPLRRSSTGVHGAAHAALRALDERMSSDIRRTLAAAATVAVLQRHVGLSGRCAAVTAAPESCVAKSCWTEIYRHFAV